MEKTQVKERFSVVKQKLVDYQLLIKLRLSLLVVFTAVMAYFLGLPNRAFHLSDMLLLGLAGFLITAASNALNQVIEKDYDKLMTRTANRPVAAGRMSVSEAVLAAGLMSVTGIMILALCFHPATAILGAVSLLSYSFIYTPMKRVSPAAVWIGAFPGALPMMIGWIAGTGTLGAGAWVLFSIQFFWQFPHYWPIAWVSYEDYSRAGFYLLPSIEKDGRNRSTALQCIVYALILIPIGLLPYYMGMAGIVSAGICVAAAIVYSLVAVELYRKLDRQSALRLMFTSFFYLPVVLIALLVDKL